MPSPNTTKLLLSLGVKKFVNQTVNAITAAQIANWNTAYGWGNHATVGYLTSTTELSDLYDVLMPSVGDSQLIYYDSADSYWKNTTNITLDDSNRKISTNTGDFTVDCGTDKTLLLQETVWLDIDFPIIIRTTGANIPTLATLNGNITMPQWAVNDVNTCESQEFIHMWKEGTTCYWHLHLTTNGLDATDRYVRFEIEFGYVAPSGAWTFPATMDSGDLLIPANTTTKTMLMLSLGSFTPTGVGIAGHCVARLKRIASTGAAPTSNPWIPMLQMHIECDTLGSRQINAK